MPRRLIKKYIPDIKTIKNNKMLKVLGPVLFASQLWHLHRRNAAKAVAIGLFFAFLPVPIQMLLAAIFAIIFRANLPLSLALVWVSNPLTWVPMIYGAYRLGVFILGKPAYATPFKMKLAWFSKEIAVIWKPLFLGSIIFGGVASVIGYMLARLLWRWWVVRHWRKRQVKRKQG